MLLTLLHFILYFINQFKLSDIIYIIINDRLPIALLKVRIEKLVFEGTSS